MDQEAVEGSAPPTKDGFTQLFKQRIDRLRGINNEVENLADRVFGGHTECSDAKVAEVKQQTFQNLLHDFDSEIDRAQNNSNRLAELG